MPAIVGRELRADLWPPRSGRTAKIPWLRSGTSIGRLVCGQELRWRLGRALGPARPGIALRVAAALEGRFAHTITGVIVGVGAARRVGAVRWNVATSIVWAWVITMPAAALISALCFWLARLMGMK